MSDYSLAVICLNTSEMNKHVQTSAVQIQFCSFTLSVYRSSYRYLLAPAADHFCGVKCAWWCNKLGVGLRVTCNQDVADYNPHREDV